MGIILIYFTMSGCGPCRAQAPIIQQLKELGYFIQIVKYPDPLFGVHKIKATPTFVIIRGQEILELKGLQSLETLIKAIDRPAGAIKRPGALTEREF